MYPGSDGDNTRSDASAYGTSPVRAMTTAVVTARVTGRFTGDVSLEACGGWDVAGVAGAKDVLLVCDFVVTLSATPKRNYSYHANAWGWEKIVPEP
jgi:hypothetical protein